MEVDYLHNPELTNMKESCLNLKEQLNNRFYRYQPWQFKSNQDTCQHLAPERPTRPPKSVQILLGNPNPSAREPRHQLNMSQFKQY